MHEPKYATLATNRLRTPITMNVNASRQRGAALVEMAFSLLIFLLFIFAIIEAAIIIYRWASANEAVRAGVRTAIVSSPAGPVHGTLVCTTGDESVSYNCDGITTGGCPLIVREMQKFSPLVTESSVTVRYTCSMVRNDNDPRIIPMVTVELDTTYRSVLLGAFGIDATIPLAPTFFQSTRMAEDLYSE